MTIEREVARELTSKKIIPCPACSCTGIVSKSELACYHKGEYVDWNELCSSCEGAGRIVKREYTETIVFKLPDNRRETKSATVSFIEKLGDRKTSDIYEIGVKR